MLFELKIGAGDGPGAFKVEVLRSEGGSPEGRLVLDAGSILRRRAELEYAVLASGVPRRRAVLPGEEPLQAVGKQLFEALFCGRVYGAYRASLGAVQHRQEPLQVMLRLAAPELAALPWEAMFDPETGEYLCRTEPLIRCVEAPYRAEPLAVESPLRILGVVAAPGDLMALDVKAEQERLAKALAKPLDAGLVDLTWAPDARWETIHELMLGGTWHVLHFVGHGGYDAVADEGFIALVGEDGRADMVVASRLADLLCEARPVPRLVVLNSCSSGEAGTTDLFSGTAAALVRQGIGAVAAMQFSISDTAAIRFARGFYTAIAHGRAADQAVRSGRIDILGSPGTLEWITPVLYVPDGFSHLFALAGGSRPAARPVRPRPGGSTGPGRAGSGRAGSGSTGSGRTGPGGAGGGGTPSGGARRPRARPGGSPPSRRARTGALGRLRGLRRWHVAVAAAVLAVAAGAAIAGTVIAGQPSGGRTAGWPFATGSAVYTQPFVIGGVLYAGSTNGHLYAVRAGSGALRWQFPRRGRAAIGSVYSRPGVAAHQVYVGSDDGRVYAVKQATGALVWSSPCNGVGDRVRASPVFVAGVVYATSGGGFVCALRSTDGSRFWKPVSIGPGAPGSSPTVSSHTPGTPLGSISLYVGSGDGHIFALNAASGAVRWEFPAKDQPGIGVIDAQPVMSADGSTLYATGSTGHVYALNAATGAVVWEFPRKGKPGIGVVNSPPAVAVDGSAVYVATSFAVYAIEPTTGALLPTWRPDPVRLRGRIGQSGPVSSQVAVYVGSDRNLNCLDAASGARCWPRPFTAGSRIVSTPVVGNNNGTIYFGTLDGRLYALTPNGVLAH
jgi:outer membrane protein assembly factor BamB